MTLFFFVVGLEIKRELVAGELSDRAEGGPAGDRGARAGWSSRPASTWRSSGGSPGSAGWGIPMATDIAFVVGVLALFGPRVPVGLKIFLLSLAIVDDIGAVLVIAVVYSSRPDVGWPSGWRPVGFALIVVLNRLGVRAVPVYVVVGAGIWLAVLKSGVHPTVAGVLLGLLTPATAWVGQADAAATRSPTC